MIKENKGKLPPKDEVLKAFNIAQRNAYAKRRSDKEVLFDVFLQGILYGKTGTPPKDTLDELIEKQA